ncbi:hypothetical protein ACIBLA_07120 [Streptomyces sp. NPDC050433]|uniref:hypothetical protein n=1 Tax=unclassified Streptomyces TaxID=2593676 RepID=UPI0034483173
MNAIMTTAEATRLLRKWATVSAVLLVPATILAGILALTTENSARCIGYNENCGSTPGWVYSGSLLVAGVAWLAVLFVPRRALRGTALLIQLVAEATFLMAVLTTYA